jgi:GDP-L-fucose synthase
MGYWQGKSVCVTGAAGMIPSYLCELLIAEGADVCGIDNLERGRIENLASIMDNEDRFYFTQGDCTDLEWLMGMLEACEVEVVFNLAAKVTAIDYNSTHHGEMFFKNMQLQSIPLEAARLARVKRFVCCSTVCVYGHAAPIPTSEEYAEMNHPEPTNEGYGLAKLMGEKMATYYGQEYGMDIAITRFANAYSERDYFDWETSHVIPALIRKNLECDTVDIWGDGEQRREFLYAQDAALGILKVAERGIGYGAVNIGTGSNVSMNELNSIIQSILGVQKPVTHSFEKPTGHRERLADNTKLKQLTGWIPETTLREGLEKTINGYR